MSFQTMPIALIISFTIFFGFVNTHQRHINAFRGKSQAFFVFITLYFILSCILGLGFLIYYGYAVTWYLPIILFLISGIIGAILFGILDGILGPLTVSLIGFIGIPVCGYFMIATLPKI